MRSRWWAAPILAGAAAVLAACGSSSPPASTSAPNTSAPASSSSSVGTTASTVTISTRSTSIGTVLTNAQGHTLYWFAIDTPAKSNCNGTCASYWPPVMGHAVAASGASLSMGFGTITRSDGSVQATYDGHPLYSYIGDNSPGQANGNNLDLNGGLWYEVRTAG